MDRSRVDLKTRIRNNPFRVDFSKRQAFNICKWFLVLFNGLLILMILGGVYAYFSEFREKTNFKLTDEDAEPSFSEDLITKQSAPSRPKHAWVMSMLTFALLLAIPCMGLVGALKEHVCLLVLYGVIFIVEAIVMLIFRSFWFLLPTLIASAAMVLVVLIRSKEGETRHKGKDGTVVFLESP